MLEELKKKVCEANRQLVQYNLVTLTWGNVSEIDRNRNLVVIKPSGVLYSELTPEKMVVVDLEQNVVEGEFRPSSDTATHLLLYKEFESIGGITHTHSRHATSFAQACAAIPCYGTTHADTFYGEVPVTRPLTKQEIDEAYELNTGNVIIETFKDREIDPLAIPAVIVASHAPFTWGRDAMKSVENSVILEEVAYMALQTKVINPTAKPVDQFLLDKHYLRKHGPKAYYGQK